MPLLGMTNAQRLTGLTRAAPCCAGGAVVRAPPCRQVLLGRARLPSLPGLPGSRRPALLVLLQLQRQLVVRGGLAVLAAGACTPSGAPSHVPTCAACSLEGPLDRCNREVQRHQRHSKFLTGSHGRCEDHQAGHVAETSGGCTPACQRSQCHQMDSHRAWPDLGSAGGRPRTLCRH